jgi:hypothetical protein
MHVYILSPRLDPDATMLAGTNLRSHAYLGTNDRSYRISTPHTGEDCPTKIYSTTHLRGVVPVTNIAFDLFSCEWMEWSNRVKIHFVGEN